MNKISVTNTAIIINDYDLGDCLELEKCFSVFNPVKHKLEPFGRYYDSTSRKLYLPAGVDIWKIRGYFNEKYYDRISNHGYKDLKNIMIKYKPRDEEQLTALKFICGVDEYSDNLYKPSLSLNLNTGKGKTYVSIASICYFKMKTIIITGSVSLLNQWKSEILKYTNLNDNEVCLISGVNRINMIMQGKSKISEDGKIFLCTHDSIRYFAKEYGWDKVYDLFKFLGIGMKIFDEAHLNFENMLMIDFYTNVYKTLYVTATPAKSSFREDRIYQLSIKNIPAIDLFDENQDPHTKYIAIKYNSKPSPLQVSMCKNRQYGLDRNKYIDYVTKQPNFYAMLRIVMELVLKCKGRVLFYVGTNEAILRVYYWISTNYPEFLGDIGIFTSLVTKEQKMEERKKRLILSTTKSAGVGEDIPKLKMTIVLVEPFKSEVIARQTLGRTRDDNTLYIEIVDLGFRYINKFYQAKLPVFNKYASDVSDSFIDQYELIRRSENIISARLSPRISPIEFADTRFDFSGIIPKREESKSKIICPIEFVQADCNPYI